MSFSKYVQYPFKRFIAHNFQITWFLTNGSNVRHSLPSLGEHIDYIGHGSASRSRQVMPQYSVRCDDVRCCDVPTTVSPIVAFKQLWLPQIKITPR